MDNELREQVARLSRENERLLNEITDIKALAAMLYRLTENVGMLVALQGGNDKASAMHVVSLNK